MLALASLIVLIGLGWLVLRSGRRGKYLPDGPPTLPVIGNIHQIPRTKAYLKFAEWANVYGGMYSLKIASKTTIVLTDRRLVKEIMDKRSAVSSERPPFYVMDTMIYHGDDMLTMSATDPRWRIARKFIHQNFMASVVEKKHMPLLKAEAIQLLRDFCVDPAHFMDHTKRYGNSFVMSIGYGIRTPSTRTKHMVQINSVLNKTSTLLQPGYLPPIDVFPIIKFLPQFLFGNWKTEVNATSREMNQLYGEYLDIVVQRRRREGSKGSFADHLIEQQQELGWTWHELCFMAGLLMEAGSDTTASTINAFIHLMTKFPEAGDRARQQIDKVVGEGRTPAWDDFNQLPLVNHIIKETIRMRPITPVAVPHALSEDIWIDGKLLPKGSQILLNAYGLHNDPIRFIDPNKFDPGHFEGMNSLAADYANLADYDARDHYGYGAGRRLCPGIHLAERTLFLAIANILWAFDILPGRDKSGNIIEPDISSESGYEAGVLVAPKRFDCILKPRSRVRVETIMREFAEAERQVFPNYQDLKQEMAYGNVNE